MRGSSSAFQTSEVVISSACQAAPALSPSHKSANPRQNSGVSLCGSTMKCKAGGFTVVEVAVDFALSFNPPFYSVAAQMGYDPEHLAVVIMKGYCKDYVGAYTGECAGEEYNKLPQWYCDIECRISVEKGDHGVGKNNQLLNQ